MNQDEIERVIGDDPDDRELSRTDLFAVAFSCGVAAGICLTLAAIVVFVRLFG